MSAMNPADILTLLWELQKELDSAQEVRTQDGVIPAAQVERDITTHMTIPLDARISKLSLICRAMWSIMQQRLGVTPEDLLKRITEIDGVDGRVDGKVTKPALQCPQCKSLICRQFNRCLFCGYEVPDRDPIDEV